LGLFRTLTEKYKPEGKTAADIDFGTKLLCSLTAGGIGAFIGTPADAALVRMQADTKLPVEQRRGYKNAIDALFRMAREEGVRGFFAGATPTVIRGLAINVGMLTTYDSFKKMNAGWTGGESSQANRFVSGFLSGWVAATVSLPFDFLKTRLQKMRPDASGVMPYKNIADCAVKVAATEGPLVFYQGYGTFVVRITPHIMLTWVFMDNVKAFLTSQNL
jgi:solute carrier family 25 oxoglutarate transporter 11